MNTKRMALLFSFLITSAQAGVVAGDSVQITLRGVPASEQEKINGIYRVGASGLRLPLIKDHLAVTGLDADQIANAAENAYREQGIYQQPTIEVAVVHGGDQPGAEAQISVGGQVKKSGPIPYRKDMTLVQALQAAGDRTEFGGRTVTVIRAGKAISLDFRKMEHKNFLLLPDDAITVEQRKVLETDRG